MKVAKIFVQIKRERKRKSNYKVDLEEKTFRFISHHDIDDLIIRMT